MKDKQNEEYKIPKRYLCILHLSMFIFEVYLHYEITRY